MFAFSQFMQTHSMFDGAHLDFYIQFCTLPDCEYRKKKIDAERKKEQISLKDLFQLFGIKKQLG